MDLFFFLTQTISFLSVGFKNTVRKASGRSCFLGEVAPGGRTRNECGAEKARKSIKIRFTPASAEGTETPAGHRGVGEDWVVQMSVPPPHTHTPAVSGAFVMYTERRRVSLTVLEDFTSSTEEGRGKRGKLGLQGQ